MAGLRRLFAPSFRLLMAAAGGQLRSTPSARQVAQFALLGGAGFGVPGLLLMYARHLTHANTGAVINGAIPVVVVVLDFRLFRRRIALRGLIDVALACLGPRGGGQAWRTGQRAGGGHRAGRGLVCGRHYRLGGVFHRRPPAVGGAAAARGAD